MTFLVLKIASPTTAAGGSRVYCAWPVATKRPGLEPGRLPCLWYHAGTNLQDCSADVKQRLIETWSSIPQTVINEAIGEWGLRLQACVKAKRRHFEHLLKPPGSLQSHPNFTEENDYVFICLNVLSIPLTHKCIQHTVTCADKLKPVHLKCNLFAFSSISAKYLLKIWNFN